jgi:hypothetical protein
MSFDRLVVLVTAGVAGVVAIAVGLVAWVLMDESLDLEDLPADV